MDTTDGIVDSGLPLEYSPEPPKDDIHITIQARQLLPYIEPSGC